MMQALSQDSTADVIAQRLRAAILSGQFKPGDRLIEEELSRTFEVSRGPVREAIRILAAEGFVVLRKNRGAVVSTPTMDDVLEVYAIRMSLGSIAVAHATQANETGSKYFAQASKLLDRLSDPKVHADASRMVDADLAFQNAVIQLGQLPRISDSFAQTDNDIRLFVRVLDIKYDTQDYQELIDRHARLLNAITTGNTAQATQLWQTHIRATVAEFTSGISPNDLEKVFERPLMRHVFDFQPLTGGHNG